MTTNVLNSEFIKRRRADLGLSTRQLAAACGTSSNGLGFLDDGRNQGELTIGFLDRLADALACTIADLIVHNTAVADTGSANADAAELGRILYATGVLTPIPALAEMTGWGHKRLTAALDDLATQLPPVGLTLHTLRDRVAIRTSADVDGDLTAAAVRSHINRDGLKIGEVRMLRRILDGDSPTAPTNAEQVALGVLANARLIEPGPGGSWRPHPDVVFSVQQGES